ncbi:FAD-binding domain [Geosmithia morbida]|uniref:ferric-chelate reductase (NADPH) n=1 Tax=Geosmithia morbida TaxID=1094350 RepID=A0A9P4YWX3_9HYPO|nr:FAD-binding domain [Geosmithia morbida]KAF4123307.1 FAD-binding domain [Geosmithia morbida]
MDAGISAVKVVAREGGGDDAAAAAAAQFAALENERLSNYLYICLGSVAVAVITWKIFDVATKWTRAIVCMNNEYQRYFARPSPKLAALKQHVLYASIWKKRHNREFQLSSAINVGTLPTRFQLLFTLAYLATNVTFCVIHIDFSAQFGDVADILRNRTGVLAVVNMVPLVLFAGRNNPLIPLLGISFDTYNLLHRLFGRIVVLEALTHVLAFLAGTGWDAAFAAIFQSMFLLWGFVGVVAMVFLSIQAWSPIRHAYYEVFKVLHIVGAIVAIIGVWYHLEMVQLPQLKYIYGVVALWAGDRAARLFRLAYNNFGNSGTRTIVEALPGDSVRVSITLARPWRFQAGQHAYLYMPSISLWQSHPFSVAWADGTDDLASDKLASTIQERRAMQKMQVSFVIRGRTGFTNALYKKAAATSTGKLETKCWVEGPYGAKHPLDSYGTVVLFAGGVGVTHQVPYVKELVAGFADGTVATRRLLLVWTIQSPEHLEWIRPWMTEILSMDRRRDVLRIMLFVSQPRSSKEIHSPSSTVQMFPGRPNISTLLSMEQEQQVGAMAVSVCGPGALSDEVRRVVRQRQSRTSVDFIEEAFSW